MNDMSLAPSHYDDLKRSGLIDKTIEDAGIKTVRPADINKKLGFNVHGIQSMYEIPYNNEYSRFRVFYVEGNKSNSDGTEKPKYLCRKDSGNHLYIPFQVRPVLRELSIPLLITEGEKKALKAAQEKLPCIAIAGLWGWKIKGKDELIPDFDLIALSGRIIHIVPDNDWLESNREGRQKNLRQAVYGLACKLIDRGAKVSWIELPK